MTLSQLQRRTLSVLRQTKKQFNRRAYQEGLSDTEFIDQILTPLIIDIMQDREMVRMLRNEVTK